MKKPKRAAIQWRRRRPARLTEAEAIRLRLEALERGQTVLQSQIDELGRVLARKGIVEGHLRNLIRSLNQ